MRRSSTRRSCVTRKTLHRAARMADATRVTACAKRAGRHLPNARESASACAASRSAQLTAARASWAARIAPAALLAARFRFSPTPADALQNVRTAPMPTQQESAGPATRRVPCATALDLQAAPAATLSARTHTSAMERALPAAAITSTATPRGCVTLATHRARRVPARAPPTATIAPTTPVACRSVQRGFAHSSTSCPARPPRRCASVHAPRASSTMQVSRVARGAMPRASAAMGRPASTASTSTA